MGMLRLAGRLGVLTGAALLWGSAAMAQSPAAPAPTSAGPGRIFCSKITTCELDIGAPPSLKYKIDASALGDADKDRLVKQCTAKAAPCVATVTRPETKSVIKAATIKFYN